MKYVKKHMVMEQLMDQKRKDVIQKKQIEKLSGHPQADPF